MCPFFIKDNTKDMMEVTKTGAGRLGRAAELAPLMFSCLEAPPNTGSWSLMEVSYMGVTGHW